MKFHVPDPVKRLLLLGRWKSDVCIACFDELAEHAGFAYVFEDVKAMSWSELPAPRRGKRR